MQDDLMAAWFGTQECAAAVAGGGGLRTRVFHIVWLVMASDAALVSDPSATAHPPHLVVGVGTVGKPPPSLGCPVRLPLALQVQGPR